MGGETEDGSIYIYIYIYDYIYTWYVYVHLYIVPVPLYIFIQYVILSIINPTDSIGTPSSNRCLAHPTDASGSVANGIFSGQEDRTGGVHSEAARVLGKFLAM